MTTRLSGLRPVHPFPARMAPSILWRRLRPRKKALRVLDPMVGSGTTVVVSRLRGHHAVGFDTDPLALLIARAWSSDVNVERIRRLAPKIVKEARDKYRSISVADAYPRNADEETRAFIRFWFDPTNRRQLAALAATISEVKKRSERTLLWCAFSRLIITKQVGASLAMDVSHSRPHKAFSVAPIRPLDRFLTAVEAVLKGSSFTQPAAFPSAHIAKADARDDLPLKAGTFDLVITSPPYLNAIDYLRGHKFSLVWMGHQLGDIRRLRTQNVGTESSGSSPANEQYVRQTLTEMGANKLTPRFRNMLARYIQDMDQVLVQIARALKRKGRAILVIGDSTIRGVFVRNSRALVALGKRHGLHLQSTRRRPLLEDRRYLPPPDHKQSGALLRARMREEVILVFRKS